MTGLSYADSIILGVLQGITEFLPISSSGHLAVTQRLLELDPSGSDMLLFDVLAHLGTLLAVVIVFAGSARHFVRRLLAEPRASWSSKQYAWRIAALAILGTIPTGIIGVAFQDTFEAAFGKPVWIGLFLIVTGTVLAGTALIPAGRKGWKDFRWYHAVLIGIAQACAIFPGISRSGSTICVAAYLGIRRRWTAEFSFLLAFPAIAGASVFKLKDTITLPAGELGDIALGPVIVGSAVSFVVGIAALKILLGAVRRGRLHYFALYCWVLGALVATGVV